MPGLRIIDKAQNKRNSSSIISADLEKLREKILQEEAKRYSSAKGKDLKKNHDEFIKKLREMRTKNINHPDAKIMVNKIESDLKKSQPTVETIWKVPESSVILDLL